LRGKALLFNATLQSQGAQQLPAKVEGTTHIYDGRNRGMENKTTPTTCSEWQSGAYNQQTAGRELGLPICSGGFEGDQQKADVRRS
jgi:hypothetical protein